MAVPRKGKKFMGRSEFSCFAKVKPGHGEALRKAIAAEQYSPEVKLRINKAVTTLHEARWVVFDNDTRVVFASSFDGDWDTYIDEFAQTLAKEYFQDCWSHTEGFPGVEDPGVKDWFMEHAVEAASYTGAYGGTVKEITKALDLYRSFQQVLDDPAAEKALANPVLKPLLAQAAT